MRIFERWTVAIAVALSVVAGVVWAGQAAEQAKPAQQPSIPSTPAEVPRMEAAEVKRLVDSRQAVLVDVRSREAWDSGHAEGALHIPLAELSARLKELPKDKLIAAYCT
jgi:3-mercaptopyruvate sulfurtransferase SseA